MNNVKLLNSVIEMLQKEADWHKENDDASIPENFKLGFLVGIAQSIFLITHILKHLHDDE